MAYSSLPAFSRSAVSPPAVRGSAPREDEITAAFESGRREERQRMAAELHDSVIQEICLLRFQVRSLEARMNEEKYAASAYRYCQQLLEQTERTLACVRGAIDDWIPEASEFSSTEQLLRTYARRFREASGIDVQIVGRTRTEDPAIAHCILRVFQEALRNAQTHGGASRVRLRLLVHSGWLGVRIVDNGAGIPRAGFPPDHHGLRNMRWRVHQLQGRIQIWSRRGIGTVVQFILPLS